MLDIVALRADIAEDTGIVSVAPKTLVALLDVYEAALSHVEVFEERLWDSVGDGFLAPLSSIERLGKALGYQWNEKQ